MTYEPIPQWFVTALPTNPNLLPIILTLDSKLPMNLKTTYKPILPNNSFLLPSPLPSPYLQRVSLSDSKIQTSTGKKGARGKRHGRSRELEASML